MSFFNKVSNIWKSMGFKESDKMLHLKEMYERSCAREKSLESDLVEEKRRKVYSDRDRCTMLNGSALESE